MAKFGAKYGRFAPITAETDTALPTYGASASIGELNKVVDSASLNEQQVSGDDHVCESLDEFDSGTVTVTVVTLADDVKMKLLGQTTSEDDDIAWDPSTVPLVGFGLVRAVRTGNETKYCGRYYPRLKYKYSGLTASTKAKGSTMEADEVPFNWFAPLYGHPFYDSVLFDTLAEAIAWVDEKLPKTVSAG